MTLKDLYEKTLMELEFLNKKLNAIEQEDDVDKLPINLAIEDAEKTVENLERAIAIEWMYDNNVTSMDQLVDVIGQNEVEKYLDTEIQDEKEQVLSIVLNFIFAE